MNFAESIAPVNIERRPYESDEEFPSPMLKSGLSSPSTVGSPLVSPRKGASFDTDEE